jgi:autotransporter-associated beta strand protein
LDFNGFTLGIAEGITINGRGVNDGGAFIGSNGTFSGAIGQATDSRITNTSGTLTLSAAVTGAFYLYIGGAGNITTSAVFAASALSITKQGAGTLTVTGANLYTGYTRVDAGTFAYAGTTTLVATNLIMNGGTFNSGANADAIGAVTLVGGTITNSAALTGTAYTFEGGTISGILAGAVAVAKNTNNTVTLTGVNTISSTTTINAGTLTISGSGSATATTITVNLGGTLTLDNSTTAVADRIGNALALTLNGGNYNFIGNSAGASSETAGALTLSTGHNTVTVTPGAGGATTMTFASLARTAGATVLFRGTNLGNAAAANVSTLVFTATPTLTGGGGASGSTTVSVIKGAFGDTSLSGTGSDMVTYQGGTGLRLLNGGGFSGEYSATLTTNTNVKLTGNVAASTVSINSLILNGFGITNATATITMASAALSGNILINSATNIAGANTTLGITTFELPILATNTSTTLVGKAIHIATKLFSFVADIAATLSV